MKQGILFHNTGEFQARCVACGDISPRFGSINEMEEWMNHPIHDWHHAAERMLCGRCANLANVE